MNNTEQKKEKLLQFIKDNIRNQGYPPTVREMMQTLDVKSTCSVQYYLDKLENENKIRRNNNKNRAIEILDNDKNDIDLSRFINIPLLGRVAAGEPILAINNFEEDYNIPKKLFGAGELFMLKVRGESMINAGIMEDDLIIVKKQETANNGEIVVAMHQEEVTVKTFYKENNRIRLQPENNNMKPIYLNEVDIIGKVVGVIRKY